VSLVIEDPAIPGDDAPSRVAAAFQGLDAGNPVDRITEDNRAMEPPFQDRQERQGIDPWSLGEQARGDRQAQQSVRDRPSERALFGGGMIDVNGVEIPREAREEDDIRLRHRPPRGLPFITDDQVVE
jgi:hypothetical protein